jgi:hypothetical protein
LYDKTSLYVAVASLNRSRYRAGSGG